MIGRIKNQLLKAAKIIPRSYFGLLIVALFSGIMAVSLLKYPSKKTYDFKRQEVSFYLVGPELFDHRPIDETDQLIVSLFPLEIQKKVSKIIRPVLILCEKYQLDPYWVLSLMWAESTFRSEVVSNKGARGLLQIMPPTFQETLSEMKRRGLSLEAEKEFQELNFQYAHLGTLMGEHKLRAKLKHLEVGIFYLKTLFENFDNNHSYATISYNMGPQWTRNRLKNNEPVGVKNRYLNKILANYFYLTKNLQTANNVTYNSKN